MDLKKVTSCTQVEEKTVEQFLHRLTEACIRYGGFEIKLKEEREKGKGNSGRGGKDLDVCFKCGKIGHWARDCPNKQVDDKEGENEASPGGEELGAVMDFSGYGKNTETEEHPTQQTHENTNTNTDTTRAQLLTQAILYLESKIGSDDEEVATTFVDYSHSAYKNMPCLTLLVKNKPVTFLVDSGTTESVVTEGAFDRLPKLSGRYLKTMGVAGVPGEIHSSSGML